MRRGLGAKRAADDEGAQARPGSMPFPGIGSKKKAPRGDKYADVVVEDEDDDDEGDDGMDEPSTDIFRANSSIGASSSSSFDLGSESARLGLGSKRKRSTLMAMRARTKDDNDEDADEFMDPVSSASDDSDAEMDEVPSKMSRDRRDRSASPTTFVKETEVSAKPTPSFRPSAFVRGSQEEDGASKANEKKPSRRGLGSFVSASTIDTTTLPPPPPPTFAMPPPSFGSTATASSSSAFKRRPKAAAEREMPAAAPVPSFATRNSKFNPAAMMMEMGWSGAGLGKEGEGMVNPIEVQLRPEKAGIAFGGRKEMTKQTRQEERRRGHQEGVSASDEEGTESDADDRRGGRRRKTGRKEKDQGKGTGAKEDQRSWTKRERKPRKPKVEHRTYEELIEEAGGVPEMDPSVGKVYDASGREHASVAAALAHHAVPTQAEASTHLPELRHNLRLICDSNRRNLDVLARQGADIFERRRWLRREQEEAERKMASQRALADSLRRILGIVKELESVGALTQKRSKALMSADPSAESDAEAEQILDSFDPPMARLLNDHRSDVQKYSLDEAVVGSVAPILKNMLRHWDPIRQPALTTIHLSRWQDVLQPERLGLPISEKQPKLKETLMSPYETLMWKLWMPPVRSAINNRWDPSTDPTAPLNLFEVWTPLLPKFILENVVAQLLLPKLTKAVADWTPSWKRRGHHHSSASVELHQILFPWLPILGDRLDELVSESKRRIKSMLKSWKVALPMPPHLSEWKQVIDANEWDSMLLTNIVPKLSARVRDDFEVNPGDQDIKPLEDVLEWRHVVRKSVMSRMLEVEFFGKWLRLLHMWLIQPEMEFEEVAQWYAFWKSWFPADVAELPGIIHGFQKGMKLIDDAANLGDRRNELGLPDLNPLSRAAFTAAQDALDQQQQRSSKDALKAGQPTGANVEVTFRTVVEDAAAATDLFVLALNRSTPQSGHALYRMADSVEGKGGKGVVFYIDDEVCFAETTAGEDGGAGASGSQFEPVSIDELVELARSRSGK
ncbi:hypothetical protein OC845_003870 [Tilletia horrida]|nr:hypothetical protein OC845_003870 [Tilletia horrida]